MVKLIHLNGEYYQLVREIKVEQVGDNMQGLKAWKDFNHCDHVLKYQGKYLLVRFVKDAEIINYE